MGRGCLKTHTAAEPPRRCFFCCRTGSFNLVSNALKKKHVIARRGIAPTWQSPGTIHRNAVLGQRLYQEIPTAPLGPRNDTMVGSRSHRWFYSTKRSSIFLYRQGLQNIVVFPQIIIPHLVFRQISPTIRGIMLTQTTKQGEPPRQWHRHCRLSGWIPRSVMPTH